MRGCCRSVTQQALNSRDYLIEVGIVFPFGCTLCNPPLMLPRTLKATDMQVSSVETISPSLLESKLLALHLQIRAFSSVLHRQQLS